MASLGEEFRAAREARKLTLSDVSEQVHIRTVYLRSIEDENWAAISAPVYVRGFVRTYARFLGLDAEAAIEQYNATLTGTEPLQTAVGSYRSVDFEEQRSVPSPLIWILGGVALLLVSLVGVSYFAAPRNPAVQATPASGAAVPAPGASGASAIVVPAPVLPNGASPAADAPGSVLPSPGASAAVGPVADSTLSVHALANSWMRVVIDGKSAFEGLVPAGSDKTFHGRVATVRVGNAGGVEVAINGRSLGTLGAPGSVVERSFPLTQEQNGR
jgi:transcriptional regulator with XRE-family HTH domain